MKKIITNQQKSRVLLMVTMYYMKAEEIKMVNYHYMKRYDRRYIKDMIDYYTSKGEWKIQITMKMIFNSFIDKNQTQLMHTKSDNVEIMNGTDTINSLVVSDMRSVTKGSRFESGCQLCAEVSSLQ